jgi:uracil-DNA glycosylase family 4
LEHCREVSVRKRRAYTDQTYWGKPVANFGNAPAKILIVGLAPGAHGANRTGRMFTGDQSGLWLYRALHRAGLATEAASRHRDDSLRLIDCAISAVCHCAPPDNRPTPAEIRACEGWLERTVDCVQPSVLLALGQIAWQALSRLGRSRGWATGTERFGHGTVVPWLGSRYLVGAYHPSQQNTFTGRLTEPMLDDVFLRVRQLAGLLGGNRAGWGGEA